MLPKFLKRVEHVSFDLWNTLISPNKEFAAHRNEYLQSISGKDASDVARIHKEVKRDLDGMNERLGIGLNSDQVYRHLLDRLRVTGNGPTASEVRDKFGALVEEFPPVVLPETVDMIKSLQDAGITVAISSNTNFITGSMMMGPVIHKLGIHRTMCLFSDQIEIAKPSRSFFQAAYLVARANNKNVQSLDHMMHIGDNVICDGKGAADFGIQYLMIDNPQDLVSKV